MGLFNLILTPKFFIALKLKHSLSIYLFYYESIHPYLSLSVSLSQRHKHRHTYCGPTSREAAARKASGDGLIDPLVKMGDISPTSISIKPLRLEASQGLLLFLFRGELRKIYRQLMVSGRKALLEYIKSTYRRRESFPCELDCFCSKFSGRGRRMDMYVF